MDIYTFFAERSNCYVSDLRFPFFVWDAEVIEQTDAALFPKEDWEDFLSYVFDRPLHFASAEEAKDYLLREKARPAGSAE